MLVSDLYKGGSDWQQQRQWLPPVSLPKLSIEALGAAAAAAACVRNHQTSYPFSFSCDEFINIYIIDNLPGIVPICERSNVCPSVLLYIRYTHTHARHTCLRSLTRLRVQARHSACSTCITHDAH